MQRSASVRRQLAAQFPGAVVAEKVEKGSGKFEVSDAADPSKVYHSKLGGDGHLDCYPDKITSLVQRLRSDGY